MSKQKQKKDGMERGYEMNATEQKIVDAVEAKRQDIIDFFQKMVQFPSLPGEEKEMGDALLQGMKDWGLTDVEIVEKEPGHPNVLARLHGTEDGPNFIFNGHMDVIHPGSEETWTDPPFSGKIKDGWIYGRGTVDMKAGTISSFLAGAIFNQLQIPIRGNVLFTAVCDEEICGERGILYLLEAGYIKKQREDDMGLNCEPTNFKEIAIATKGLLKVDITVHGKSAFGARPWLGINAIDKANKLIHKIRDLNETLKSIRHPILNPPSIMVAIIEGGQATNIVPDYCKVTVTRRLLPGETKEECLKEFQDIFDQLKKEDPEFEATLNIRDGFRPPAEVSKDTVVCQAVAKAHKLIRGEDLAFVGSEGGTDASHVVNQIKLPMPVYGPGEDHRIGMIDECIKLDDVVDAVKVYALTIYYTMGLQA